MDDVAAHALKYDINIEKAKLYKNTGDEFQDVAGEMKITAPTSPMVRKLWRPQRRRLS